MIFNRSHYEDVLVVRVHNLAPAEVWKRRYGQINDFERMLANEGTEILKFYLHIGWEEQKERFQARLENQNKQWKFNLGDLEERKLWTEYMRGRETYDRLKGINPDIKVLFSSGYSIKGHETQILERSGNGFIQKPFDVNNLSQKIRNILDKD